MSAELAPQVLASDTRPEAFTECDDSKNIPVITTLQADGLW